MFYKLPAASVQLKDAAFGAIVAAVGFELMKRGFAYYISVSSTYSTFYGVLVTFRFFYFGFTAFGVWCSLVLRLVTWREALRCLRACGNMPAILVKLEPYLG